MPKHALAYAWTVSAVGAAVTASAALLWQSADGATLLLYLGLAALASTFKVKLPGLTGTISPGFVFLLVAVSRLSWSETVAIGVASALVQSLWRAKRRPANLQIGFNAATMAIAGGLAYGVSHGLTLTLTGGDPVLLLAVSGVVLLVANTLMVSVILCLLENAPLSTVWHSLQPRTVPYYLAGGLLAGVWARADLTTGVALMAAVSVYLLGLCYRETAERFRHTDPGVPAESNA